MGILDDAIREHLELKRAHGASEDEVRRKEVEAFGPARQEAVPGPLDGDATQMLHPADAAALEAASDAPVLEPDGSAAQAAALDPTAAAVDPEATVAPVDPDATVAHQVDFAPEPVDLAPEPLDPAAADPHAVHPGDHPLPDPHDHLHPGGSDPAWAEDTEFFSEPEAPAQPVPHHDDEPHPALHDHDAIHAEEHPPEPVFRDRAGAPAAPDAPIAPAPVDEARLREPDVDDHPLEDTAEEDVLEETPEFLQDAPEHDRLWFEQKPPRDFDFGE